MCMYVYAQVYMCMCNLRLHIDFKINRPRNWREQNLHCLRKIFFLQYDYSIITSSYVNEEKEKENKLFICHKLLNVKASLLPQARWSISCFVPALHHRHMKFLYLLCSSTIIGLYALFLTWGLENYSHIWPDPIFTTCELRIFLSFLNSWKKLKEE